MAGAKERNGHGGRRPGSGRKKGTPNKLTKSVKDAIEASFWAVGGQEYLERISEDDPRTYLTLLGKVVPTQLQGELTVKTHEEALAEIEQNLQSHKRAKGKAA